MNVFFLFFFFLFAALVLEKKAQDSEGIIDDRSEDVFTVLVDGKSYSRKQS